MTGSFDYYTRYTDGMVGPAPELPLTLGIATPKTNNCDLKTRGWELQIGWNDRLKNGLGYSVRFMLSDAKTIIDSYPGNNTHSIDSYLKAMKLEKSGDLKPLVLLRQIKKCKIIWML